MLRGAVLEAVGDSELQVRSDLSVVGPGPNEVRVRVRAAGVCHSDLSAMDGTIRQRVPAVLGHEGAGEVVEVGGGVSALAPGDHVSLAWIPPCGGCRHCLRGQPYLCTVHVRTAQVRARFTVGGRPAFGLAGCGTWAEEVVVPQQGAIRVEHDVPFEVAALLGCGVTTGVGAVLNTAKVEPGATVLVIGCGGVGVSLIQAARVAGASTIVGVDPVPVKHELARRFGATAAATPDTLRAVAAQVGVRGGFDYAFEVVGSPATIRAAWDATRRGGTTVVVGVGSAAHSVQFSAAELVFDGKRLLSSLYGSADVRRDYPRILGLWRSGQLDLAGLVSRRVPVEEINDAVRALRTGEVLRQLVTFGASA